MADSAWRRDPVYRSQRRKERRSLTGIVAREAERESERIPNRSDPRRTYRSS